MTLHVGKVGPDEEKLRLIFEWQGILATKSKVDLGCDTRKEGKAGEASRGTKNHCSWALKNKPKKIFPE